MRRLPVLLSLTALLWLALAATTRAQSVRWEPAGGTLANGQRSDLSLIFELCEPKDAIKLPPIPGLALGEPSRGEQNSFNLVNGQASRRRTVYYTYPVRPTGSTTVTIPAFTIETDKGPATVASVTFQVGDATVGQGAASLDSITNARFNLPGQVWAGEVFPLNYSLTVVRRYFYQLASPLEWNSAPLTAEEWTKPEFLETSAGGEVRVSVNYRTRAIARSPGTLTLQPATQLVNIQTGSATFGLFAQPNIEQFSITTKRTDLTVRPLPAPAPATFNGSVGEFTLTSKVVPATATVGEPITWTLELAGTGNWPDIRGLPSRSVSRDFRVVSPQAKRTNKENTLFDAALTEDIVLIPSKPGTYTLGPISYTTFDPKSGTYKTLTTEATKVTILPPPVDPNAPPAGANHAPGAGEPGSVSRSPIAAPTPPASIPRDPLPPAGSTAAPLARRTLFTALAATPLLALLTWVVLAWRQARATDPARPVREARVRAGTTLQALARTPAGPERAALIRAWQHDTAVLWQLPRAVPTADAFTRLNPPEPAWAALWSDAERALYGADATLPSDWVTRAQTALAAKRVRGFSPFQLFLPRNLLPFVAALVLAGLLPAVVHGATATTPPTDPREAYAKADFATAEKGWRDTLAQAPTNWVAHHNLALALAQQNRFPEAAGHAAAAFVQQPANASVRWHLGFALEKATLAPPRFTAFVQPGPLASLARLASPTRWQHVLLAGALLASLAVSLRLVAAYGSGPRALRPAANLLLGLTLVSTTAAALGLSAYGETADARAALVWRPGLLRSIPTEVDTTQKTTPLTAGTLAIVDKTFLGWNRLAFPNGQTGWVRKDDVVMLWR